MRNHCARGTRQVCDSIAAYGIGFTGHGAMIWLLFNACPPPPGGFPVASWTSSGAPSRSPQETHKPKVTPTKSDNRRTSENALMAISTRTEQKRRIAQAVLFGAMRQTADVNRTQNAAAEPPAPRCQTLARTHARAGAITGQTQPFAGALFHHPIISNSASPRQRGTTPANGTRTTAASPR